MQTTILNKIPGNELYLIVYVTTAVPSWQNFFWRVEGRGRGIPWTLLGLLRFTVE